MGNKVCKKKPDVVDNNVHHSEAKSNSAFNRIFTRLHLKPNTWKSEPHLNKKQVSRSEDMKTKGVTDMNNIKKSRPISKSTDWSSATLEVPDDENPVELKNAKLSLIYNDKNTPTPPPRKHKRKSIKEKIESVTKTGLQAIQKNIKPVEEEICTKKIINYHCPVCDKDYATHNRDHKHVHEKNRTIDAEKTNNNDSKLSKRKKNLSVVSLPNYNDLKLAVAHFDDIDKQPDSTAIHNSITSVPNGSRKLTHTTSAGRLESYMTRCRSFGSLLPQQLLHKLRTPKKPADVESDDSFGALEDWDLKIIEHYNPKDASLPRPRKPLRPEKDMLKDLEGMIVQEEVDTPVPPARRSESPVKKQNKMTTEAGVTKKKTDSDDTLTINLVPLARSSTEDRLPPPINYEKLPKQDEEDIGHSKLMKILQEYSIKDKQKKLNGDLDEDSAIEFIDASSSRSSNVSYLATPMPEYENKVSYVQDFINAEIMQNTADRFAKSGHIQEVKS